MIFSFLKKLVYIWMAAYLAFLFTSVLFGGRVMKGIGEKSGIHYFEKLADESDAIKHKVDSLLGRAGKLKEQGEEKSAP